MENKSSWSSFVKLNRKIDIANETQWPELPNKDKSDKIVNKRTDVADTKEEIEISDKQNKIVEQQSKQSSSTIVSETSGPMGKEIQKKIRNIANDQHLQIIDEDLLREFKQSEPPSFMDRLKKNKKFKRISQEPDNLLSFLQRKPMQKTIQQFMVPKLTATLARNKGKKKEVKRIKYSQLKKSILKARETKKIFQLNVLKLEEKFENIQISPLSDVTLLKDQQIVANSTELPGFQMKHSRNFRSYCDHFITTEIKNLGEVILKDLFRFQENAHRSNPIKAKANKRYVVGFNEVLKFLETQKLKLIIISPDLEPNLSIDEIVDRVKKLSTEKKVPYIFSVKRRHIGYLLLKKVPISCVGVFNYEGTHANVKSILELVSKERMNYLNYKKKKEIN